MSSRRFLVIFLWAIMATICGCKYMLRQVVLSRSPDGQKQILIYYDMFDNGWITLKTSRSERNIPLISVAFCDANERIMKFSWSLDSSKIGFLISHSNRKEWIYGKRLVVFDLSGLPDEVKKVYYDQQSNIEDLRLTADEVTLKFAGREEWERHRFSEE